MATNLVPSWFLIVRSTLGLTEIIINYINVGLYEFVLSIVGMFFFVRDLDRLELG